MQPQSYQNHKKIFVVKSRSQIIYYITVTLLNVLAAVNLVRAIMAANGEKNAVLFMLTAIALASAYFLFRSYALKAQDRAIRAEENLRHLALTGKLLNPDLNIRQVIALRFAPDEEFVALAEKAAKENLSNDEIKRAVKNWRGDYHRA